MGLKHAKFDRFDNLRGVLVCDLAGWIARWMFLPWSWVRWTGEDCSVDWWVPFRKKSPPRMVQSTSLIRFGWPPVRCGRPDMCVSLRMSMGIGSVGRSFGSECGIMIYGKVFSRKMTSREIVQTITLPPQSNCSLRS
ncbi:hypothetical protein Q3G72_006895 [Acer saccharum]|nr:hypothetical protein Q3G72_006895 [Acer saccharum]